MVFKTLVRFFAEKRMPLIKFRKGGNVISSTTTSQPQSVSAPVTKSKSNRKLKTASAPAAAGQAGKTSTAIEYWDLPPRFRRRPIDEFECEYINRGGPDKL